MTFLTLRDKVNKVHTSFCAKIPNTRQKYLGLYQDHIPVHIINSIYKLLLDFIAG